MPQNKSLILQTFRPVFRSSFNSKPKTDFYSPLFSLFTLISSRSSSSLLTFHFSFLTFFLLSSLLSFISSRSSSSLLTFHFSLLTSHSFLISHFSFPTPFPLELTPGVPIFRGFQKKANFILVRV